MSADVFSRKLLANPQDLNLYAYTVNNPLRYTDPNGRDWKDVAKGIAQGANNFVNHTYSALVSAAKDPLSPVQAITNAVSTAVTAYGTAKGRSEMLAQFKALSTQDKTAVVTEALIAGGVGGAGAARANGTASATGTVPEASTAGASQVPEVGQTVFRVWGNESGPNGQSWTPIDPNTVSNYRSAAGLPNGNDASMITTGTLINTDGVTVGRATELDGNPGGLAEFKIPDPQSQVLPLSIKPFTPEAH
jgi:hypothetical protein